MLNTNPYVYWTKNFRFSYHHDRSISIVSEALGTLEDHNIQDKPFGASFVRNLKTNDIVKINIPDYAAQATGRDGGLLIQYVLSSFAWSFVSQEDHREQLMAGLKYFVIAENFKLMVSSDVARVKLEALQKDYEGLKEAYPKHCVELNELEQKALELHINEPLVGTTGFMAYPTRECIWLLYETQIVNPNAPEYLYQMQKKVLDSDYLDNDFEAPLVGTQQECIISVMEDQVETYGISIETLSRKRQDNKQLLRMFEDLEIVLKIPLEQTWEYMKNKEEMDEVIKGLTDENVNQLYNYAVPKSVSVTTD